MKKIYNFKAGDAIRVYTMQEPMGVTYQVESTENNIISCRSQAGDKTMFFPAYVPMPFAVEKVGKDELDADEDEESHREEQPKSEPKPEVQPEPKPEAKPEVKPEPKPEVKPEAKPEAKPEEVFDGQRVESYLDYYKRDGGWGKIHEEGKKQGLFFHISAVVDDKLRFLLNDIEAGAPCPKARVSYIKQRNSQRKNEPCAGEIMLLEMKESVEPDKADNGEMKPCVGYLYERYDDGKCTIVDVDGKRYKARIESIEDETLKQYILEKMPYGSLDSYNVQVEWVRSGKGVVLRKWLNHDEVVGADTIDTPQATTEPVAEPTKE